MTLTLAVVSERAHRPIATLSRRDVALALLSVPANEAAAVLPQLRRGLLEAGNPLSMAFWDSASDILTGIARRQATVGAVRRWLEATGTEPMQLIMGGFVWPDEGERGPVALEMHTELIAHLEELVVTGTVDADRLIADDADAWNAYEQAQIAWMTTPLPDGRTPLWAVEDEDDATFTAAWDEAEADARNILSAELAGVERPACPDVLLHSACDRVRAGLADGAWPYDLLRAAGGVDPAGLSDDDQELWLTLASGVVTCRDEPPEHGVHDTEVYAAWYALDHPAWIGVIATLARLGPGAAADADGLAHYAATFDFEADDTGATDEWDLDDDAEALDEDLVFLDDDETVLQMGFGTVELLWQTLGAIDDDARLTPLGWWGVPEATLRAWGSE